jgi:hypothetical protein
MIRISFARLSSVRCLALAIATAAIPAWGEPITTAAVDKSGAIHLGTATRPVAAGPTVQASDMGQPIANPLTNLTPQGIALLKKRGIDVEAIQSLKAILIKGDSAGKRAPSIVNADPNLMIVFGSGFITQAPVQSAGPIIATRNAHFMNSLKSDSIIWFVEESIMQGEAAGNPIIVAPNMQMNTAHWMCDEVWIGKYGWPDH